jgi:hypothetical protein
MLHGENTRQMSLEAVCISLELAWAPWIGLRDAVNSFDTLVSIVSSPISSNQDAREEQHEFRSKQTHSTLKIIRFSPLSVFSSFFCQLSVASSRLLHSHNKSCYTILHPAIRTWASMDRQKT